MLHLTKKKVIISLSIFAIICIGVTVALIIVKNMSKSTETLSSNKKIIEADGLGIKSLTDMCYINNLNIETVNYHEGEEISVDEDGNDVIPYFPFEINYDQISGLKDTKVQEEINNQIKELAFAQEDEEESNLKVQQITITASVTANFSNILSVSVIKSVMYSYDEDNFEYFEYENSDPIGLNFNLQTGEQIVFSDMFTNTADTKNIIAQSAYTSFVTEEADAINEDLFYEFNDIDMSKYDYSEIEDKIFKLLSNYDRNNNYNFYFDAQYIYVNIDNNEISIPMRDFYTQIAIYNRYADYENLYEEENRKEFIVFSHIIQSYSYSDSAKFFYEDYHYYRIEEVSDNLFIDIQIDFDEKTDEETIEEFVNGIETKLAECKDYASKNPDKAILFVVRKQYYIYEDEVSDYYSLYKVTMDKTYYDSIYLNHILHIVQVEYSMGGDGTYRNCADSFVLEFPNEHTGFSYEEQQKYMDEYFEGDRYYSSQEEYIEEDYYNEEEDYNKEEYIEDEEEDYNEEEYIEENEEYYIDVGNTEETIQNEEADLEEDNITVE